MASTFIPQDFADEESVAQLISYCNADFAGNAIGDLEVLNSTHIDVYIANVVNLMTKVIDSGIFVEK
ncbi:hypothetical protein K1728_06460 [Weissella confusa]|uniref:hypothetical protein n=1 Tax=Weissella confusa TaxID=1583 RepID=UPI001C6F741F|nr:hypothetical protein [Weissella confusa]QYU56834.1 hypothetical protein K1728_06460 [Weissella confusa]